jgi:hypothetical protein
VFAKKAKVSRTPQTHKEADPLARKANLMRTPVQRIEPNLESAREDLFAKKANVARTTVGSNTDGPPEEAFAKTAKVLRTPVQQGPELDGGNIFAKNTKMTSTPVAPLDPDSQTDNGAFAKKSKLARTPAQQASHPQASTTQAESGSMQPVSVQATPINATKPEEDLDQIFGKKAKLQRTPAQSSIEQENTFVRNSKLQRTPAPTTTENSEEVFMKKSKLGRTPIQAANTTSSSSAAGVAPAPPPATLDSMDAFSSKSKLQRSPILENNSNPAAADSNPNLTTNPNANTNSSTVNNQSNPTTAQNPEYSNVFAAKTKLGRTPNPPVAPTPQPESSQEPEDGITITKFDTAISTQKTTPKKRPVANPQPILKPPQPPNSSTPSQKPKPAQSTHPEHPAQNTDSEQAAQKPQAEVRTPQKTQSTARQAAQENAAPRTPTKPTQLSTPPRSAQSRVATTTPRSSVGKPFNDVTDAFSNSIYVCEGRVRGMVRFLITLQPKPIPGLRTPISEKTASLLTPMKDVLLFASLLPFSLFSSVRHAVFCLTCHLGSAPSETDSAYFCKQAYYSQPHVFT